MILTKEQIESELKGAMAQAGKLALEEAAKIAESHPDGKEWIIHKAAHHSAGRAIATKIRALAAGIKGGEA